MPRAGQYLPGGTVDPASGAFRYVEKIDPKFNFGYSSELVELWTLTIEAGGPHNPPVGPADPLGPGIEANFGAPPSPWPSAALPNPVTSQSVFEDSAVNVTSNRCTCSYCQTRATTSSTGNAQSIARTVAGVTVFDYYFLPQYGRQLRYIHIDIGGVPVGRLFYYYPNRMVIEYESAPVAQGASWRVLRVFRGNYVTGQC